MTRDVLVHFRNPLDPADRRSLVDHLSERLGIDADAHVSARPHLLFLPADPVHAPPHAVLRAVRARGYDARLVDL